MTSGRDKSRGFTSLEVLVSLTLLGIIAAGLTTTTVSATKANTTNRDVAAAATLIYDKVEQFRADANAADLQAGEHDDRDNPLTALGEPDGRFMRRWTVTRNVPKVGMAKIAITVSWEDSGTRSVPGVTYVCTTPTCS